MSVPGEAKRATAEYWKGVRSQEPGSDSCRSVDQSNILVDFTLDKDSRRRAFTVCWLNTQLSLEDPDKSL